MMEHEEYNFSLELPYEVITRMDPVDLPPNMRSHYEKYLESEIDKDSITFKRFKEREKYAANFVLMGEIIHNMIDKDLSFNDAYNNLRGSIDDMMKQLDEIFGELLEGEEAAKLFMQLFQNVLKSAKKIDDNKREEELDKKVFIGIRDVDGKIVSSLDEYGVDYLVVEILTDKEVSSYIENSYVKPIKGMLMEYISLFTDEDEEDYADMFTTLFIQSKEYIAYQALLNLIIMDSISNGTKVSDTIREIDRNKLVSESKKMILSYQGFDEYREEIEATMKLLLDAQTQ